MVKDQAARERVLDLNTSFLVQAPAGSGKTSILVQRFLSALAVAKTGPEEIIAITFTRKAAAQMRARILDALSLATKEAPTDAYALTLWQLARRVLARDKQTGWCLQDNPSRLKIQTIDSLCSSIVQQMPILARFGAQPQIEPAPELLYARAVEQLLVNLEHTSDWQSAFFCLLQHLDNDRLRVKNLLIDMLQIREHWLLVLGAKNKRAQLKQQLEKSLHWLREESLADIYTTIPAALNFSLLGVDEPTSIDDWLHIAVLLLTSENTWRKKFNKNQGFPAISSARNDAEKELLQARNQAGLQMLEQLENAEAFRLQLELMRKLPPAVYTEQQWQVLDALTEILPLLAAQLLVVFRDSGTVDFTEVALAAIHALADVDAPTDLALTLDCKIQHILVDEFQDTSHLQFKLLEQLTASWEPYDGRSLFLVGDPMQSIYRFRQAEVGLFLKAKEQGINNIALEFVQLQVNFRAQAALLNKINQIFIPSFPQLDNISLGAISYMPAQAAVASTISTPIEFIAVESETTHAQIVTIIQQLQVNNPQQSIAVLVQAKTHLLELLPALKQAQIAYQGLEIEKLEARPLIQDLCALTNSILHLDDRIAWLAILRAPWCGLSLADLAIISDTDSTIWAALQTTQILDRLSVDAQIRVGRFTAVLQHALQQLARVNIDQLINNTWLALGGMECLISDLDQYQEAEAFFALLAKLNFKRELLSTDFLRTQINQLFLSQTTEHNNPVQIMTMHKAKGLEFDVVILPALDRNTRNNVARLLLLEQRSYQHEYLLVAPIKAADEEADTIYNYLDWCEKQRQEYEQLRLLYVAMTRAKQKLYCLADIKEETLKAGGILKSIWPIVKTEFVSAEVTEFTQVASNKLLARLPIAWYQSNPYTVPAVTVTDHKTLGSQQDWLRLTGIALHRILWHIAVYGLENFMVNKQQMLEIFLPKYLRQLELSVTHTTLASNIIQQALANMLADPIGTQILSKQHVEAYAEWRLTYVSASEFVQVVLDRAFLTKDNTWWLVDYKIVQDPADISMAVNIYKGQIQRYARILQELKTEAKIIAGLYFPLQAQWREVEQLG